MARLSGVDLPREKRLIIALTYIYGVGPTRAKETIEATGLSPDLRARDLTDEDLVKLRAFIDGDLFCHVDSGARGLPERGIVGRVRSQCRMEVR